MIKISKNRVIGDFSIFEEFCSVVEKSISSKSYIYMSFDGEFFRMFSESLPDDKGPGCVVENKIKVSGGNNLFEVGVDGNSFLLLIKRLYSGDIQFDITDKALKVKKDNIKASLPIKSSKNRRNLPEYTSIVGAPKDWILSNLMDSLSAISETQKTYNAKFSGILMDNCNGLLRICKFSSMSLFLSCGNAIFESNYRTIIPDLIAKLSKSFKKTITAFLISENSFGIEFSAGTKVFVAKPNDTYPLEYLNHLSLEDSIQCIPAGSPSYTFNRDVLLNAIDLVVTTLGDSDSWVSFEIVGKTVDGSSMVWRVGGTNYTGLSVTEEVTSSLGDIIMGFGVNKLRALKALPMFGETLMMYNLSPSVLALSDSEGRKCVLLTKSRI